MGKDKKSNKSNTWDDIRFVIPRDLADLFRGEAKKERRKYSAHLAIIFEQRYKLKEQSND